MQTPCDSNPLCQLTRFLLRPAPCALRRPPPHSHTRQLLQSEGPRVSRVRALSSGIPNQELPSCARVCGPSSPFYLATAAEPRSSGGQVQDEGALLASPGVDAGREQQRNRRQGHHLRRGGPGTARNGPEGVGDLGVSRSPAFSAPWPPRRTSTWPPPHFLPEPYTISLPSFEYASPGTFLSANNG